MKSDKRPDWYRRRGPSLIGGEAVDELSLFGGSQYALRQVSNQVEKCQCRSAAAQKNHIGCVILAWNHMTMLARRMGVNIYSIKKAMLSSFMKQELRAPSVPMSAV